MEGEGVGLVVEREEEEGSDNIHSCPNLLESKSDGKVEMKS